MVGIRIRYKYENLNEKPKTTIIRPAVGITGIGRCQSVKVRTEESDKSYLV